MPPYAAYPRPVCFAPGTLAPQHAPPHHPASAPSHAQLVMAHATGRARSIGRPEMLVCAGSPPHTAGAGRQQARTYARPGRAVSPGPACLAGVRAPEPGAAPPLGPLQLRHAHTLHAAPSIAWDAGRERAPARLRRLKRARRRAGRPQAASRAAPRGALARPACATPPPPPSQGARRALRRPACRERRPRPAAGRWRAAAAAATRQAGLGGCRELPRVV